MTAKEFKKGEKVSWNSTQGTIKGTVKRTLTTPMDIKTHRVAASPANPEILVQSTRTGQLAAHKPAAFKRSKAAAEK